MHVLASRWGCRVFHCVVCWWCFRCGSSSLVLVSPSGHSKGSPAQQQQQLVTAVAKPGKGARSDCGIAGSPPEGVAVVSSSSSSWSWTWTGDGAGGSGDRRQRNSGSSSNSIAQWLGGGMPVPRGNPVVSTALGAAAGLYCPVGCDRLLVLACQHFLLAAQQGRSCCVSCWLSISGAAGGTWGLGGSGVAGGHG